MHDASTITVAVPQARPHAATKQERLGLVLICTLDSETATVMIILQVPTCIYTVSVSPQSYDSCPMPRVLQ